MNPAPVPPVRKSVIVRADTSHAFRVFTECFDSWWPRTHHIGKSPMTKTFIEGHAGGRCCSEQEDGTQCDWGTVTAWEPPHRLVLAWQITHEWGYEPDLNQASEVEILFRAQPDGSTLIDLEHRRLERHGAGATALRLAIDSQGGWELLLRLYVAAAEKAE